MYPTRSWASLMTPSAKVETRMPSPEQAGARFWNRRVSQIRLPGSSSTMTEQHTYLVQDVITLLVVVQGDNGNLKFACHAELAGRGGGCLGRDLVGHALGEGRAHGHEESE